MSSAEGQVQHLSYVSTFPILLNIGNQPTYFVSLKDNAGLVKMFAFVNVERYQLVAIGDTLNEAYSEYLKLLAQNTQVDSSALTTTEGVITYISSAVRDGNTFYYIELDNSEQVFVASIQSAKFLQCCVRATRFRSVMCRRRTCLSISVRSTVSEGRLRQRTELLR